MAGPGITHKAHAICLPNRQDATVGTLRSTKHRKGEGWTNSDFLKQLCRNLDGMKFRGNCEREASILRRRKSVADPRYSPSGQAPKPIQSIDLQYDRESKRDQRKIDGLTHSFLNKASSYPSIASRVMLPPAKLHRSRLVKLVWLVEIHY